MKKLLFVISQFYKGGAETALLNLLKYLDKSKYEIDLIVMNQQPVKNAVSLIEQLPKEICILNAYRAEKNMTLADKLRAKLLLKPEDRNCDPSSALLFVRNKEYDWAFHVGEWWLPKFVVQNVHATNKCAWLHTDISKADSFDAEAFFHYDEYFSYYVFVSRNSLEISVKKYPFIRAKSRTIYNINDAAAIREAAEKPVNEDYFDRKLPVVLTLGNVRKEKGHQRALEAMHMLSNKGIDFLWVNVGSTTEKERCQNLLCEAEEFGLKDKYILAGSRDNPYPYIKRADIVAVLSDYESWSMVITEAKILGKPIIATKTSGALEQIADRKNGLLTDFNGKDIAEKLEELLTSKSLRDKCSNNLEGFDNTEEKLRSFDALLKEEKTPRKKELLYVIDDINYVSGAHRATKLQIQELVNKGKQIDVFSTTMPNVENRCALIGVRFLSWKDFPENELYYRRLLDCLFDPALTKKQKQYKKELTYESKIRKNPNVFEEKVLSRMNTVFSGYETVCVMSEGSGFRKYVADSDSTWKVQWIHTDYCRWRGLNEWTRSITKQDQEIYEKFDRIVLLSDDIKNRFTALYPTLENKTIVNANLIPVDDIRKNAETPIKSRPYFVTVGRFGVEKAYDRLFRVLYRLTSEGYKYHWTIIGGGELYGTIRSMYADSAICSNVTFTGPVSNPYPMMKEADVFALFSNYEGLPNTIFESLILGVPVVATNVGGISTQIVDGKTGWLVENDEEAIYQKLTELLRQPAMIEAAKENLKDYSYDNQKILSVVEEVLFPCKL